MYPEAKIGGGGNADWKAKLPDNLKNKIPNGADGFYKDGTVIVFTKGGNAMQGGKFTENGDPYNPTGSENANKPVDGGNGNGTVARTGGAGAGTGAGNGAGGAGGSSSMFQYGFSQNTSGDIGASFLNGNYYIDPNKFMGASANFGIMSSIAQLMPFGLGSAFANMTMGGVLNGFMKSIGFNFDFSHFNAQSTTTTTTTTTGTTTTGGTSTTTTTTTGTTTTSGTTTTGGTTTGNSEYRAVPGSNGNVFAKTENGTTVHYIKQDDNDVPVEHYDKDNHSYYLSNGDKYSTDGKPMLSYSTLEEFKKTHSAGYKNTGNEYTDTTTNITYVYDDKGKLTKVKQADGTIQKVDTNSTKAAVETQIENLKFNKSTMEVTSNSIEVTVTGGELTKLSNSDLVPEDTLEAVEQLSGHSLTDMATFAEAYDVLGVPFGNIDKINDIKVTIKFEFDDKGNLIKKHVTSNLKNVIDKPENFIFQSMLKPYAEKLDIEYEYKNFADGALRTKK